MFTKPALPEKVALSNRVSSETAAYRIGQIGKGRAVKLTFLANIAPSNKVARQKRVSLNKAAPKNVAPETEPHGRRSRRRRSYDIKEISQKYHSIELNTRKLI